MTADSEKSPSLNVKAILGRFGGKQSLYRQLLARGCPIKLKTIEKWSERGSIPARWLTVLLTTQPGDGKPFDLREYLLRR